MLKVLAVAILLVLGVMWGMYNLQPVTFYVLPWRSFALPGAVWAVGLVMLGMVLGYMFSLAAQWRLQRKVRQLQKLVEEKKEQQEQVALQQRIELAESLLLPVQSL